MFSLFFSSLLRRGRRPSPGTGSRRWRRNRSERSWRRCKQQMRTRLWPSTGWQITAISRSTTQQVRRDYRRHHHHCKQFRAAAVWGRRAVESSRAAARECWWFTMCLCFFLEDAKVRAQICWCNLGKGNLREKTWDINQNIIRLHDIDTGLTLEVDAW